MRLALLLVAGCSAVETHIATSPAHYVWAEPAGKAAYPLVLCFDGSELVQPLARIGYGVAVLEPNVTDAVKVLSVLRGRLPRWDGQLVVIGARKGVPSAIQLASERSGVAGVALLTDETIAEVRLGNVFYGRGLPELLQWLCRTARASGCPLPSDRERFAPEPGKAPGEDLQLNAGH